MGGQSVEWVAIVTRDLFMLILDELLRKCLMAGYISFL